MSVNLKPDNLIYLLPLEQAKERSECGGKAANLSILLQTGFPVPPGFVVKTQGVEALAGRLGQEAHDVALQELDTYISLFGGGISFAVRSSAVVEDGQSSSFAGIFHSQLNIQPELTAILDAIIACREAVYNERVYQYMNHHNIPFAEGMLALIVQQMVQPDSAGVAFSQSFTSQGSPQILIEAVSGLGENLVSGRLTPTRFLIPRSSQDKQEAFLFTALQQQGADLPGLNQSILEELCGFAQKRAFAQNIDNLPKLAKNIDWE
jgi:phosphoenolpyruvate synthase/pyruvate phosphate dikinase